MRFEVSVRSFSRVSIQYFNDRNEGMNLHTMRIGGLIGENTGGHVINSYYGALGLRLHSDLDIVATFKFTPSDYERRYTSQERRSTSYEAAFVEQYREER